MKPVFVPKDNTPMVPQFRTIDGLKIHVAESEGAGRHFVWEEAPSEYASIILGSVTATTGTNPGG